MVKTYTCEKCGKVFNQKGHYTNHLNRKTPCKPIENKIIEEKLQEKYWNYPFIKGDIEIKNTNLISSTNNTNTDNMEKNPHDMNIEELEKHIEKVKARNMISKKDIPRPLIKWVGGKVKL